MGMTFYEIDPSGDTLLILQNANAPFAILPTPGPEEELETSSSTPDEGPTGDAQDADSKPKEEDSKPKEEENKPKEEDSKPKDADSKPTVQMRLSSKHLTLASKYFQKLTTNNLKDSKETTPEYGYSYVINANNWDEKALLVLMNIIHGRTGKVPRSVDLEMLAKIAVLVDYYQCHEAVEFFSQTWLNAPSISIPKEGERDFMLRLAVCMVFSETSNFQLLTKTIIWGSTDPIDSLGLPIRQDIIDALNDSRESAMIRIELELDDLKSNLCINESCSFECSSIYLGVLTKAVYNMSGMDEEDPFDGQSLLMVEQAIRDIKEPTWKTNCPKSSASPKESTKTSTKPTPGQASNVSSGAPSTTTKTPFAQAATTPKSLFTPGGLFGNTTPSVGLFDNLGPSSGVFDKPVPLGSLFGKPVPSATASSSDAENLSAKLTPPPPCNLAAKTSPIFEELHKRFRGLELSDYVKKE